MSLRRLFASLIAVLCIAGWIGLGPGRAHRAGNGHDEVATQAGSGAVGCHSPEAKAQPRSPAPPRGLVACSQPSVAAADASADQLRMSWIAAPVVVRSGGPGAPRGPPSSFVVA